MMAQLAQAAAMQRVLRLQGELLPRADLAGALDGWHQLVRLVRTHVCPSTRQAPLAAADVAALVDVALPRLVPPRVPRRLHVSLRSQFVACASCAWPRECPVSFP